MMGISYRFLRVWQRNRDVFAKLWRSEVPGSLAEPVFVLLAMGIGLGTYVQLQGDQTYLDFIAPGILAGYAMFSASFETTYGSFFRMKTQKTYDAIISTPVSIEDVVAGEVFWGATRATITAFIILGVTTAFGLVHSAWALAALPLAMLAGLMFSSIGLFFTALAPSIHTFNYYFTLFLTPMFFFSGLFFPLDGFSPMVQNMSWIAPLTPVVNLTRAVVTGQPETGAWWSLSIIAVHTTLFFYLALTFMKRRLLR